MYAFTKTAGCKKILFYILHAVWQGKKKKQIVLQTIIVTFRLTLNANLECRVKNKYKVYPTKPVSTFLNLIASNITVYRFV